MSLVSFSYLLSSAGSQTTTSITALKAERPDRERKRERAQAISLIVLYYTTLGESVMCLSERNRCWCVYFCMQRDHRSRRWEFPPSPYMTPSPPLETHLTKNTPFQAGLVKPTPYLASVISRSVRVAPDGEGKLNSH